MKRILLALVMMYSSAFSDKISGKLRSEAEQGNADAQVTLGMCYDFGNGVLEDDKQAVYWYTKAAEQGNAEGQYWLALCYEQGEGVLKNEIKAYAIILHAQLNGYSSSRIFQFKLDSKLTQKQREEAQELAKTLFVD